MRYFKVDVRKEPPEYGFLPTMQMYLPEGSEKKRDLIKNRIWALERSIHEK